MSIARIPFDGSGKFASVLVPSRKAHSWNCQTLGVTPAEPGVYLEANYLTIILPEIIRRFQAITGRSGSVHVLTVE